VYLLGVINVTGMIIKKGIFSSLHYYLLGQLKKQVNKIIKLNKEESQI